MADQQPVQRSLANFAGRWVVISGASSGLGRAAAVALASHGACVALLGRDEKRLTETAELVGQCGGGYRTLSLDLARGDAIAPAILGLRADVGPIYGLCHAAGLIETRPLSGTSAEAISRQMEVNVVGGVELARAICRRDVITPDEGSILFLSSISGHVGVAGQIGYCATKGAISAAARAMAIELARRNIRVNCVSPGFVETEMAKRNFAVMSADHVERIKAAYPLGTGQPEDVARAIVFMLAPESRWITGADLVIDGGFTAQ